MSGKLRFEAWTLPTAATFKRKIISIPALPGATGRKELSGWSDCTMSVPESWDGLSTLLSSTEGSLVRVYDGTTIIDEFIAERMPRALRQPSSIAVTGPQVAGLTSKIGVFPPDYGSNNPSKRPNWVWAGDNAAGPLELDQLGNINETYEVYLSGERYVLDKNSTTAGTFTLTVESQTTDPIDWDASSADIQSALEALSTVDEATVRFDDEDNDHQIVFDDPKDLSADMTMDDSGLTGTATLTKGNDGFDTSVDPTFTITVDGQTTEALAWDASANTIEGTTVAPGSGIEGLSTVSDVTVSGTGVFADPWVIVFYDPPHPDSLLSVTFAAGTAVRRRTVVGDLDPSPVTRSKPVDQGAGDEEQYGEYENPALQVVTDATHLDVDADYAILVNVESGLAGSQRVLNVIPGETYQAKIRVKPTSNAEFSFVIRSVAGDLIDASYTNLTSGSYQDLTISDVVIPDGVEQVIFRVAISAVPPNAEADIGDFYANWQAAEFVLGMPATNPGDIVKTLLEHAQERNTGDWLDVSFDDTNDTDSTAWTTDYSYQADGFAMYLSDVLADMRELGYEWSVTPKASPSGGKTHDLNLWETDGAGTDRTSTGPTLLAGGAVVDGQVVDRIPAFTAAVGWGADDLFVEDTDATTLSNFGRWERFLDAEQHANTASIQDFIDAAFSDEEANRKAGSVKLSGGSSVVPFIHFDIGDTLVWQAPPSMTKNNRRVQVISWRHGHPVASYEVQGSRVWDPEAAPLEALIRLLDKPNKRRRFRGRGGSDIVRPSTGEVTGAHIHLERSSTLSLTSGSQTAIPWTFFYETIGRENFPAPSFPATAVTIQEPGYYDIEVGAGLASAVSSAKTEIARVRGDVETVVWPPSSDPGLWDASFSTSRGRGVAKGIPCRSGDQIKVYVTQSSGSAVNLTSAYLAVELVDRVVVQEWELVFTADNYGVTWDGSSWWTTDHSDDVDPALFERDVDGSVLNSYSGYDVAPSAPDRNRGIVFGASFLWGVGNQDVVHKIDPSTGGSVSNFAVVNAEEGVGGIGYNGTNLFITGQDNSQVQEFNTAGTHQGDHAFPSGRTLKDLTWDGANWWATLGGGQGTTVDKRIVRMDSSFNETLAIPGPQTENRGLHFRDGYLYVMTSQGLYRKAI